MKYIHAVKQTGENLSLLLHQSDFSGNLYNFTEVILMSRIALFSILSLVLHQLSAAELGARLDNSGQNVTFNVYSSAATRVEVWFYNQPLNAQEVLHLPLSLDSATKVWTLTVPLSTLRSDGVTGTIYYGYRAWGPNWSFDPTWTKGSGSGFHQDVDPQGNRFNPNKLLLDPYTRLMSATTR